MSDEQPDGAPTPEGPAAEAPGPGEGVTAGGYSYSVVRDDGAGDAGSIDPAVHAGQAAGGSRARVIAAVAAGALLLGAIGGAIGMWLLSGGDDSATRAGADTANVINAFSQGQGVDVTRYEGELPPGFPEVPTYGGAEVIAAVEQFSGDDAGYLAVYDTPDSREDVAAWYRDNLVEDPWQVDAGQDGGDSLLLRFSRIDDANVSGVLLVGESKDGDYTTILVSANVIAGGGGERAGFSPGVSKPLPDGFPSGIPAYPDAVVIETAFEKQAGSDGYAVSLITTDNADDVLRFYEDAFSDNGWDVAEGDPIDVPLDDAQAITFLGGEPETSGSVTAGVFSKDANYTRIDLQVRTSN